MVACTLDEDWPVYVAVSLLTFFSGLVLLIPMHVIWRCYSGEKRRMLLARHGGVQDRLSRVRTIADGILSGTSVTSKLVMIVFWLTDITASVVYVVEATMSDLYLPEESSAEPVCGPVQTDPVQYVWIGAMSVCLLRFVIKFIASAEKLYMWIDLFSIVDHLTIGPTFVGLILNKNWLGLRFLRMVYLLKTPDILQLITLLKSRNSIRVAKAASAVLTVWMCGAGMYHILENIPSTNERILLFWDSFYLVLITLTTIGYGDISPKTPLGKAFTIVFVVLALATFCTLVADVGRALSSRSRYRKEYKRTFGRRHIVICGGITFETLTTVVKNFIHEDSPLEKTDLVIVDAAKPSAEIQAFFRRHFNNVTFVQGTVLDIPTLKLAKVERADVVLILANRRAEDQDEEDAANIMRATAVKNISSDIRIIIQLLQHHNKERLLHIPSWNWHSDIHGIEGDEVICISEFKMGFMAQNCLAPGIVTMLSNLICMRSFKERRGSQWLNEYGYGAGHEIYAEPFASHFHGLTFTEAAVRCMTDYGILLVAVRCAESQGNGRSKLRVNPNNTLAIHQGDVGIFIAQDPAQVQRISQASAVAVNSKAAIKANDNRAPEIEVTNEDNLLDIIGGPDTSISLFFYSAMNDPKVMNISPAIPCTITSSPLGLRRSPRILPNGGRTLLTPYPGLGTSLVEDDNNNEREMFDPTNMFHWCPPQSTGDVVLDKESVRPQNFCNHVIFVLCTTNNSNGQELGLVNFVKPLRASSIQIDQLKPIIFYAEQSLLEPEWSSICNYPKIFIYPRTRSIYVDLRRLSVHKSAMCLVLGEGGGSHIDDTLVDKNSILTVKNILSLNQIEEKISKIGVLADPDQFRQQIAMATDISLLIELEYDASVAYIDDDDDDDPNQPLYQTIPYVCGRVLLASVLDSLVATTYISRDVLTLTRALLTGGENDEFETILAEGVGIVRRGLLVHPEAARRRCTLTLLSLTELPLKSLHHKQTYGQLAVDALRNYGLLFLGLYRLLNSDTQEEQLVQKSSNRYVITHPPFNFSLRQTDKIYALKPYEFSSTTADDSFSSDVFDDVTDKRQKGGKGATETIL